MEELLRHAKNFFTCSGRLVQEGHHSKLTDQTGHLVAQTMKLLEKWNEELLVECNGPDDDKDDDRMLFVLSQALETIDAITGLKKPSTSGGKTVHWEDEASITNRTHDKGESKIAGEPLPHQIPPIPNAKHENTPARLNRLSGELDDVDEGKRMHKQSGHHPNRAFLLGLEDDPAEHPPKSDHAASS